MISHTNIYYLTGRLLEIIYWILSRDNYQFYDSNLNFPVLSNCSTKNTTSCSDAYKKCRVFYIAGKCTQTILNNLIFKGVMFLPKLWFFNPCILATRCRKPLIFQTINSLRTNSLSWNIKGYSTSGCKDIRNIKFEFVTKTQLLLGLVNKCSQEQIKTLVQG